MAYLTFTSTSTTLTCTVNGMSSAYAYERTLKYYIDGVYKGKHTTEPYATTDSYEFDGLTWKRRYAVRVDIYSPTSELLASLSGNGTTAYASITPFSWTSTNDRQKAYNAVSGRGYTGSFKYTVWNDIVDKIEEALTESGYEWDERYASKTDTEVPSTDKALYATKFNSSVENVKYDYWTWEKDNADPHYLGRREVKGFGSYQYDSDYVYGSYIIELVKNLNTMISRYCHTGSFSRTNARMSMATSSRGTLIAAIIKYLRASADFFVDGDARLVKRPSRSMRTSIHTYTDMDAELHAYISKVLRGGIYCPLITRGKLRAYGTGILNANMQCRVSSVSEVTQAVAKMLNARLQVRTSNSTSLKQHPARPLDVFMPISIVNNTELTECQAKKSRARMWTWESGSATLSIMTGVKEITVTPYTTTYEHLPINYDASAFSKVTVNAIAKNETDNLTGKTVTLGTIAPDNPSGSGARPYTATPYTTREVYIPTEVSQYGTFDKFTVTAISRTEEDNVGGGKTVTIGTVKGE